MNCPKCNSPLKEGANFCTECGETISQQRICTNCGAEIKDTAMFCTHCGAKQTKDSSLISEDAYKCANTRTIENSTIETEPSQQESETNILHENKEEKESSQNTTKKKKKSGWIWGIILIIITVIAASVTLYIQYSGLTDGMAYNTPQKDSETSTERANERTGNPPPLNERSKTKEYLAMIIKKMYTPISEPPRYIFYLSREFKALDTYAQEVAMRNKKWDYRSYYIWYDSKEYNNPSIEVLNISFKSNIKALVTYKVIDSHLGELTQKVATFIFEHGDWYVDDLYSKKTKVAEKKYMSDFIKQQTGDCKYPQVRNYFLSGNIHKYPIEMHICQDGDQLSGSYHYTKTGSGKSLKLVGRVIENGNWILEEFDEKGKKTGVFDGCFYCGLYFGDFKTAKGDNLIFYID